MSIQPDHRALWSGLQGQDKSAEIGVMGIPFDGADITSLAALKIIYEAFGFIQKR